MADGGSIGVIDVGVIQVLFVNGWKLGEYDGVCGTRGLVIQASALLGGRVNVAALSNCGGLRVNAGLELVDPFQMPLGALPKPWIPAGPHSDPG